MGSPKILINVDVEDLAIAERFYQSAFGMQPKRRLGGQVLEMDHGGQLFYLLEKPNGSQATSGPSKSVRTYDRHWTPIHLDFVVDDVEQALAKAVRAGAVRSKGVEIREFAWGKIIELSDPFGNGFCLLQFLGRGYDEVSQSS